MKHPQIAKRLVHAQLARPRLFLIAGLVVTAVTAVLAANLRLDSSYEALLPEGAPEIRNANEIRTRTGGVRKLIVAIGGDDEAARLEFAKALAARVEQVENVRRVELEVPTTFLRDRAIWLLDDETFDEVSESMLLATKRAREQGDPRGLQLAFAQVRDALETGDGPTVRDGVATSRDGRYVFLTVVPSISLLDYGIVQDLVDDVDGVVASLDPDSAGVEVRYAGNIAIGLDQQRAMVRDLRNAAILALVLGVLVVAFFTRSPLAPLVIGAALLAGVTWTFALSWLLFGHLNVITGFLVAVLIGLGIDFGIHIYIRYRQELRAGRSFEEALEASVTGTLRPAVTGALTTAGTFATFCLASFRGFSEFGLIAAAGVVLTLVSSFLLLPPLLVVTRRWSRCERAAIVTRERRGLPRWALSVSFAVVGVFLAAACFGAMNVTHVTYRNDFRRMRGESEATSFTDYVNANLSGGFNPAVILVDDLDAVARVEQVIATRNQEIASGGEGVPVRRVLSIADLMPHDVEGRTARVEQLERAMADPAIDEVVEGDETMTQAVALARQILRSRPWTIDEVPEAFRQRFVTLDGNQLVVYAWPEQLASSDVQAIAWEHELSELRSRFDRAGVATAVVDESLIHAWIHRTVSSDGLLLLELALGVVFVLLLIDLRSFRKALLVALPLAVGVLVLVGAITLLDIELNLFNIIVLPCVIGIGIDNVVHIYHRYRHEGTGSLAQVVRRTGAAALLTSLTTGVGFGSSLISHHLGLRSMGTLAVLAIASTLLSAVVFFPCLLAIIERRRAETRRHSSIASSRQHLPTVDPTPRSA